MSIARVEELLAYRLPHSGNQLNTVVLSRTEAEELMREIAQLRMWTPGNSPPMGLTAPG